MELKGLGLNRGETTILKNLDWRVHRGEHWVIMGPNGSGKTSLLKVLTGYMSASQGGLALLGHQYGHCDWRDLRLHIGVVSSVLQPSIPPAECALDTVVSGRYAQLDLWASPSKAERSAALRWLGFFQITQLANRPWLYLSQGERQRVLLARALMAKPRLLILDEPCSGLDPVARESFLGFLERLAGHRNSPPLLLVTHHPEEITPGFTHALLLREGHAVASGELGRTLTSQTLAQAFGAPLRLRKRRAPGGYRFSPVWM